MIRADMSKPKEHYCPKCGAVGVFPVFKMPCATHCQGEGGEHWEVHYPGDDKPTRYGRLPRDKEIRAEFERKQAEAEAAKKPARKARNKSEE